MGREIKRVPFDFGWPIGEVWHGYLMPDSLIGLNCPECTTLALPFWSVQEAPVGDGYSPRARQLKNLWYGNAPFRPEDNGSTPLTVDTPAVRTFAERNVTQAPGYYGRGEQAVICEATRLCELWNGAWSHHLNADDVAALVEAGRLKDFTHRWTKGEGWQLWETFSEGSPQSPVFATDEMLAAWLTTIDGAEDVGTPRHPVEMTLEQACAFVRAGWAPTGISNAGGYHNGAEFVATEAVVRGLFGDDR